MLMYLSDVEEGGETVFPNVGISIKPKKGNALFWFKYVPAPCGGRIYIYIYVYVYIHACVCVCVCVSNVRVCVSNVRVRVRCARAWSMCELQTRIVSRLADSVCSPLCDAHLRLRIVIVYVMM